MCVCGAASACGGWSAHRRPPRPRRTFLRLRVTTLDECLCASTRPLTRRIAPRETRTRPLQAAHLQRWEDPIRSLRREGNREFVASRACAAPHGCRRTCGRSSSTRCKRTSATILRTRRRNPPPPPPLPPARPGQPRLHTHSVGQHSKAATHTHHTGRQTHTPTRHLQQRLRFAPSGHPCLGCRGRRAFASLPSSAMASSISFHRLVRVDSSPC